MTDDYTNEVIIYGMFGGVQTPVSVDADGNLQAVLLGDSGGVPTPIALDADGRISALLYGVYVGTPTPVAVDANGRLVAMSVEQGSVLSDANELTTLDTPLTSLLSNMNRIRHWIVALSGESWGTVTTSTAALLAKFHATTGHAHTGSTADAPVLDHGGLSGKGDDDHTQYILADGSRAFYGAVSMGTHKIENLTSGSNAKDAVTFDQLGGVGGAWSNWSPTLAWTGGIAPSSITTISRYLQIGKLLSFYLDISSADSNACTGLTVTLPVAPTNQTARIALACIQMLGSAGGYISHYPLEQSGTYVKATTEINSDYYAYFATDPTKSLTANSETKAWQSTTDAVTNQAFHIDLGSLHLIKRIYYENGHHSGILTDRGVRHVTFWGSNSAAAFADTNCSHDTDWTQITMAQATFDRHSDSDAVDPKYITLTNTTTYRYYRLKFADTWGSTVSMIVRRIELQALQVVTNSNPLGYILADGSDNKINFTEFQGGVDGDAIRIVAHGSYEVD